MNHMKVEILLDPPDHRKGVKRESQFLNDNAVSIDSRSEEQNMRHTDFLDRSPIPSSLYDMRHGSPTQIGRKGKKNPAFESRTDRQGT
jgi:hypothetical protein